MVPRLGDDFEMHDFDNYLFDVAAPLITSRRAFPADETAILDEFHALTAWCGLLLAEHGISTSARILLETIIPT